MKKLTLVLAAASMLAGVPASSIGAASDAQDTATQYLRAWSYKDYASMNALSGQPSGSSSPLPAEAFFGAAARLPVPAAPPRIVARNPAPGGNGETVYFEYTVSGRSEPQRGSIVLSPQGVVHPELLAAASSAPPPPADAAPQTAKSPVVDGETADSIMRKMNEASKAVQTLQGDVVIKGSMMGTRVSETATLLYKAPDKIRLQSKSFIMNADGSRNILYMPEPNVYLDLAGMGELELTPGIGLTAEEMREKYEVQLSGKDEVDGEPVFRLQLKPPTEAAGLPLNLGQGSSRMTLWVSARTWLPVRASLQGMKVDYKNMRVNAGELDDTAFDFKPPKGATAFSLGGLLGALGNAGDLPAVEP